MRDEKKDYQCSHCGKELHPHLPEEAYGHGPVLCQACFEKESDEEKKDIQFEIDKAQGKL